MSDDQVLAALARLEDGMAALAGENASQQTGQHTGLSFLRADLGARVDRMEAALARLSDELMERMERVEQAQQAGLTFLRVDFSTRVDRIEAGLTRLSDDLMTRLDRLEGKPPGPSAG